MAHAEALQETRKGMSWLRSHRSGRRELWMGSCSRPRRPVTATRSRSARDPVRTVPHWFDCSHVAMLRLRYRPVQHWGGKEPRLTRLVSPNGQERTRGFLACRPPAGPHHLWGLVCTGPLRTRQAVGQVSKPPKCGSAVLGGLEGSLACGSGTREGCVVEGAWGRVYRGTSLIRNSAPLGPYGRTMPRALWNS